jgi:ABC-type polysaccharide/polyol phosphate export permease
LVGATLEFMALLPLLLLLGVDLTPYALFLPVVLILEFLLVFGIYLSLSSLSLRNRDFYQLWDSARPIKVGAAFKVNQMPRRIQPQAHIPIVLNVQQCRSGCGLKLSSGSTDSRDVALSK